VVSIPRIGSALTVCAVSANRIAGSGMSQRVRRALSTSNFNQWATFSFKKNTKNPFVTR
jgi:hypothetical protein